MSESTSQMPWEPGFAPATWAEVKWPDWVPQEWREQIEDFWGEKNRRKPQDYENGMKGTGSTVPAFGHVGWFRELCGNDSLVHGRYIHAWNNIGRLVDDEGQPRYVSGCEQPPPQPQPSKWAGVAPMIGRRVGAP